MSLNDKELLQYSRQIMLPQIDVAGQEALQAACVLIVGQGGLGAPVAMYLAAAGVGELMLADADTVDLSNLQRQITHSFDNIGESKVASATATLYALNPSVVVTPFEQRLSGDSLHQAVSVADVVVDCSDNFATRFELNRASIRFQKPLVSGAAIRFEGQVSVFNPVDADCPCYACLYEEGADADLNCSDNGIIAPLTGIIGSYQALEVIKLITGAGKTLTGKLLLVDGLAGETRTMKLRQRKSCKACSVQPADGHFNPEDN